MSLSDFVDAPWQRSHEAYERKAWTISPAPEYANSEVLLASLYRAVGFGEALKESEVPQRGRDLERDIQRRSAKGAAGRPDGSALDPEVFQLLMHSVIESPKLPNQSKKRFLQVTPIVGQAAIFSGAPRLTGSPWSAGALIQRMIWLGSPTADAAQAIWSELFDALKIDANDDVFARFLQSEIAAWVPEPTLAPTKPNVELLLDQEDVKGVHYPARQFTSDLRALIAAKNLVTRRQWTSLLEAVLRAAAVGHVMWLCELQAKLWELMRNALFGDVPKSVDETRRYLFARPFSYLTYGDRALPGIKDRASQYLRARLAINATLWTLVEVDRALRVPKEALERASSFHDLLAQVSQRSIGARVLETIEKIEGRENRAVLCNKGIGSNLVEFSRHVLGQRQTASQTLRGYDQGFVLRKRSSHASSPWIVGLGPVATLALVHCSLAGSSGPRSVRRFAQHLGAYGISIDHMEIPQNELGHQLRMLGLVLDSPDAESGMLLVPPFGAVA